MKDIFIIIFVSLFVFNCSSSLLSPPVLINGSKPYYPLEAKLKGAEGAVDLLLEVSKKGDVKNVKIEKTSGYKVLDIAAVNYAENLKFKPAFADDKPANVWVTWKVKFQSEEVSDELGDEALFDVLVFTKTTEYRHQTIQDGITALEVLAKENYFNVDFTSDSTLFNREILKNYQVVIFLNTSGNVLNKEQETAFQEFINNGGGFVGVHSAINTEYDWGWYGDLIGAYFDDHPKIQKATIDVLNKNHIATKHLPDNWERVDEWYNLRAPLKESVKVLAALDENTYEGGKHYDVHPFTWYHEYDGGRSWVTIGGHTKESYREVLFLQHLLGGIKYAAGFNNNL